jgi:hypothetical protein
VERRLWRPAQRAKWVSGGRRCEANGGDVNLLPMRVEAAFRQEKAVGWQLYTRQNGRWAPPPRLSNRNATCVGIETDRRFLFNSKLSNFEIPKTDFQHGKIGRSVLKIQENLWS